MKNPATARSERAVSRIKVKESARTRSCVASMVRKTKGRGGEMASPSLRPVAQYGASYSYVMPIPPSLNASYKNIGRGRAKTDKYKKWCRDADIELACQKPVRFDSRVDISIYLPTPKRCSDIDNRIKPICDSLVRVGVLANDDNRYVRSVRAAWSYDETECRVILYHAPAEAA
jgi:crossover junction endodeoxyribonuclease RusA